MPSFSIIARVELHKDDARTQPHPTSASEYSTLHAEMWDRGFRRFFKGASGNLRKLPPGEYHIDQVAEDGSTAREAAMDKAKAAATIATSKERFSVVLTGNGRILSYALEIITEDPDAAS